MSIALAACAIAGPAFAGGFDTHRVVLRRSWTPSVLKRTTHRLAQDPGLSVAVLSGLGRDGERGRWLVWSPSPGASQEQALRDEWATGIVSDLYQARRKPSAPRLSAVLTRADWARRDRRYENAWPRAWRSLGQSPPDTLRVRVGRRAAKLGLELRSFQVPRLDGILAPVVTLQVRDRARFKRRYVSACAEPWMFGPRHAIGSPYFGYFLTVADSSGAWLYSIAAGPNGEWGASSAAMLKLFPPPTSTDNGGGICPARFRG